MWFFIAILSSLLFGMSGLFMKVSQMQRGSLYHLLFGLFVSGCAGFFIHSLWKGGIHWSSWELWLGGLIVGVGAAWGNLVFMKVLDYGPASLSSPLVNLNIVIVILLSTAFYHEPVGFFEIIGIVLLLIAVILISVRKEPLTIKEKKWFYFIALAIFLFTFRNGGLKVTQEHSLDNTQVLFFAYLISAASFLVIIFFSTGQGRQNDQGASMRIGLLWGLLCGLFSYGGLQLYSLALEIGKASVVAPIFATNSLVIAIGSILLYNERLKPLQVISLFFLFVGLIFIKI